MFVWLVVVTGVLYLSCGIEQDKRDHKNLTLGILGCKLQCCKLGSCVDIIHLGDVRCSLVLKATSDSVREYRVSHPATSKKCICGSSNCTPGERCLKSNKRKTDCLRVQRKRTIETSGHSGSLILSSHAGGYLCAFDIVTRNQTCARINKDAYILTVDSETGNVYYSVFRKTYMRHVLGRKPKRRMMDDVEEMHIYQSRRQVIFRIDRNLFTASMILTKKRKVKTLRVRPLWACIDDLQGLLTYGTKGTGGEYTINTFNLTSIREGHSYAVKHVYPIILTLNNANVIGENIFLCLDDQRGLILLNTRGRKKTIRKTCANSIGIRRVLYATLTENTRFVVVFDETGNVIGKIQLGQSEMYLAGVSRHSVKELNLIKNKL